MSRKSPLAADIADLYQCSGDGPPTTPVQNYLSPCKRECSTIALWKFPMILTTHYVKQFNVLTMKLEILSHIYNLRL